MILGNMRELGVQRGDSDCHSRGQLANSANFSKFHKFQYAETIRSGRLFSGGEA